MIPRVLLATTGICIALSLPAYAVEQPIPGHRDDRIRYVDYDPANVVELWSTPGAVMVIQFAPDEIVTDVASADSHTLKAEPRENYLFLKMQGCLVPEPVIVLTKLPDGKLRRYTLQVETKPPVCTTGGTVTAVTAIKKTGAKDSSAKETSADPPAGPLPGQNLQHISEDALAPGQDVDYSVVFRYPGDAAARRRAAELAAQARWRKEQANRILTDSTTFDTRDPYSGSRNLRYVARGDPGLTPRWVWDNGYSTLFMFPAQQRIPSLYYVAPDGKESTATYSVHGDTVIATGTAREWRLRDGANVMEIWDLGYNPVGTTPGTGTISPYVDRVINGGDDGR